MLTFGAGCEVVDLIVRDILKVARGKRSGLLPEAERRYSGIKLIDFGKDFYTASSGYTKEQLGQY